MSKFCSYLIMPFLFAFVGEFNSAEAAGAPAQLRGKNLKLLWTDNRVEENVASGGEGSAPPLQPQGLWSACDSEAVHFGDERGLGACQFGGDVRNGCRQNAFAGNDGAGGAVDCRLRLAAPHGGELFAGRDGHVTSFREGIDPT